MCRLIGLELAQGPAGEKEAAGLNGVLVRHQNQFTLGRAGLSLHKQCCDSLGHFGEGFRAGGEILGMTEICGALAGEMLVEFVPGGSRPAVADLPLCKPLILARGEPDNFGHDLRRFERSGQRGGDHRTYWVARQSVSGGPRLRPPFFVQAESRQRSVDDVPGVIDLAMADKMNEMGAHGCASLCGRESPTRGTVIDVTERFAEPVLHVDMDAFFVEVERLRRPELIGRAVIVGGTGPRAVVAAASYEAREFGVGSAMPMAEARRRCPGAIVVPPEHRAYSTTSRRVFDILRSFTPRVEGLSVDEAFLDIRGLRLHYEGPAEIAAAIRKQLRDKLSLPASVGGASNKFLAKIASEEAKPDGVLIVPAGYELDFLHPLPVRRLWGVGEATFAALEALGIATVADLAATPLTALESRLGRSLGGHLSELSHGRDDRPVVTGGEAKSISVEETFVRDLTDSRQVEEALFQQCDRLSARLNAAGVAGRTITLKLRFGDFTTLTRAQTLAEPVDHTPDLWETAGRLLARIDRSERGIRLLGLGASTLVPRQTPRQLSLEHPRREAVSVAAEEIRARFGVRAVIPARLAPPPGAESSGDDGPESP